MKEYHKKLNLKYANRTVYAPQWLDTYKEYYDYDTRVVKIFRLESEKIIMENIDGFILSNEEEMKKLDLKKLRYIINEVFDIWVNQWKFTTKYLEDDQLWIHNDFNIDNLMYADGRVRLIDPDSFVKKTISKGILCSGNLRYGKFFETYTRLLSLIGMNK
tara:strand:+ start:480 stop:959 length:480 start_codon:yes stop_codon:yes gene_type:complete